MTILFDSFLRPRAVASTLDSASTTWAAATPLPTTPSPWKAGTSNRLLPHPESGTPIHPRPVTTTSRPEIRNPDVQYITSSRNLTASMLTEARTTSSLLTTRDQKYKTFFALADGSVNYGNIFLCDLRHLKSLNINTRLMVNG